jgi:hypothetical protein
MTYSDYVCKATSEEMEEIRKRIYAIIGTDDQIRETTPDRSQRIQKVAQWKKQFEKLAVVFFENGEKALAMNFTQSGRQFNGVTANGKRWTLYGNCGYSERSRYCGTLYIEGEGCVFTSGRLDKVFDYILNN